MSGFLTWVQDFYAANSVLFQAAGFVFAIVLPIVTFFLGKIRGARHARRLKEVHDEGANEAILIAGHYLWQENDGTIRLEVESWGPSRPFSCFNDPILEKLIKETARLRKGIVRLEDERAQTLFMSGLRDLLTGADSAANVASVKGRVVHHDHVVMCPVSWPGTREGYLVRVVVFDIEWLHRLCDPAVLTRIHAVDPRYENRAQWLNAIAVAWRDEQDRGGARDAIWDVIMRSVAIRPG